MNKPQTVKKSKAVYIIGSITLGIIALLAVYLILIATGVISAEPIVIVVSTSSHTAEYDGTELTDDGWSLDGGKLKDGHELRVTVTGRRTEVGVGKNTATAAVYDERGYDVTDSYKIQFKLGELEITPRKVVVQSASAEKMYDGTPLTANSCTLSGGSLLPSHRITYYVNGTLTASGKADNTFTATVTDGERDVTHNYDLEYLYGTLYVHGEKLEILTHTASKVYDGEPLTCDGWTLSSGVLADGDTLEVKVEGTQTQVGSSDNIASCRVLSADGTEVTARYEAVFTYGTLTVEPIIILVETRPAYKVYDGTPLVSDAWRVVTDSTLATDEWKKSGESFTVGEYTVSARVVGKQTDVGSSDNTAVFVSVTTGGKDSEGVEVRYKLGALTVAPRGITVQSGTDGKQYDGTPLTCNKYEVVSSTKVAEGQRLEAVITGTVTYVGVVANTIAEVKVYAGSEDVTRNYDIKLQEGQLAILGDDPSGGESGGSDPSGSDGSGDIDDSGQLGGGGGNNDEHKVALQLRSDRDGDVYLRYMSYGDYSLKGWEAATEYGEKLSVGGNSYGMNYLTGIALASVGSEYHRADIKLVNTSQYYLPYYLDVTELGYTLQDSDVEYTGNNVEYAAYYYAYNYISDGGRTLRGAELGSFTDAELAYRQFVYNNYLAVPDGTREYLDGLVSDNGFAALELVTKISAVASYVRSAAKYNLEYDLALDDADDVVVAFLDSYKEGVCRHYASAATLIYRTLGIPSRYCIGYVATAKDGEWVDVTTDKAHAWTEVYIDGVGWIQLEVTGGGAGFDGTGGSGSTGIGDPESDDILYIKPFDVYLAYGDYTGEPLTYTLDSLQGLTDLDARGYRYEFTVVGAQNKVGIGESRITSFALIDAYGNDATKNFNIILSTGKLHIYMQEITVRTQSLEQVYDGTYLRSTDGGWECLGALLDGHSVGEVTMTGMRRNVGRGLNTFDISIVDGDGNDVTYMYKINADCGELRVTAREITITAGSAVGYLNELGGAMLVCGDYEIASSDGMGLGEGDEAEVEINGAQGTVGRSQNTVGGVVIRNADGEDVTSNYSIKYVNGTLTVLPRRPAANTTEVDE